MTGKRQRPRKDTKEADSGQMILLGGFLIAVLVVSLAVVVGGTFYSQSSVDRGGGGLSTLTSEVEDQVSTAKEAGLQNIVKGNQNATQKVGRNRTQQCTNLTRVTTQQVREQVQLSDDQVILDIEPAGDGCDDFVSNYSSSTYAFGQSEPASLPGVEISKPATTYKVDYSCADLRDKEYVDPRTGKKVDGTNFDNNVKEFNKNLRDYVSANVGKKGEIPGDYNETKNPGAYDYTKHKVEALEMTSGIDLGALPGSMTKSTFAEECLADSVLTEVNKKYACSDLRSKDWTGFDTNVSGFNSEAESYLYENVGADGEIPNDYNETENPSAYNYTKHKLDIIANTTGINVTAKDALPDGVTPKEFVNSCVILNGEEGRAPVNVMFVIDRTGSMEFGDSVPDSEYGWESADSLPGYTGAPYYTRLGVDAGETYRPETEVPIYAWEMDTDGDGYTDKYSWLEIRGNATAPNSYGVGDVVYLCTGTYYPSTNYCDDRRYVLEITGETATEWEVDGYEWTTNPEPYNSFTTTIDKSIYDPYLYPLEYSLNDAPQRMWYTQLGLKAALDDLKNVGPDRAGLISYNEDANTRVPLSDVDPTSRSEIARGVDRLVPAGATDITSGIKTARNELPDVPKNGRTNHIVLMTDGKHTDGGVGPVEYVNNNEEEFSGDKETYIHSINLGGGGDKSVLKELANAGGSYSGSRPAGEYINGSDPSEAKTIFEDIIGTIQEESGNRTTGIDATGATTTVAGVGENVSAGTTSDTVKDVTFTASSGAVEKIYDFSMNISEFDTEGSYTINLTDTNAVGTEKLIWGMTVERNTSGTPSWTTQVRFNADQDIVDQYGSFVREEWNTTKDINSSTTNMLIELAPSPKLDLTGTSYESDGDYDLSKVIKDVIKPEISGAPGSVTTGGVAIKTSSKGLTGPVNGTFSFEVTPRNDNFSALKDAVGGFASRDYCTNDGGTDITTCNATKADNGEYATAKTRTATFIVTVEGPNGVSEREVTVELDEDGNVIGS